MIFFSPIQKKPEIQNQGFCRGHSFWKLCGKICLMFVSLPLVGAGSPWHSSAWRYIFQKSASISASLPLCLCMSSLLIRMPSLNIDSVVIQDDSIPRSLKNLLRQCFQEKLYLDVPSIQYFYSLQTLVITFPLKDNHFELYPLMNLNPKIIQSYIFIHLKYMWKLALSSA